MSEQQESAIKCFGGGKSKAVKGLRRYLHGKGEFTDEQLASMLFQSSDNGKWCFDAESVDTVLQLQKQEAPTEQPAGNTEDPAGDVNEPPKEEQPDDEPAPAAVFGNMNGVLSNVPHQPAPPPSTARAQSRSSYTIEKNRPEQHGIKRPSLGGLCRAVWDAMDELRAQQNGAIPTSEQVRALAESRGWNKNNAMIEFYQWRKFNGISGRTPKAAPPVEGQQPQNPPEQLPGTPAPPAEDKVTSEGDDHNWSQDNA
jgi:hypothetical protein